MLNRKNTIKTLLTLSAVCLSLSISQMNVSALQTQSPPNRTVNDYNIYKPVEAIEDTISKEIENTKKSSKSAIEDYIPYSNLKTVDNPITNSLEQISTKSSDELFASINNNKAYSISEDGKVTLSNEKQIETKLLNTNYSVGQTLNPEYIIIHDTGNRGVGADADAHYKYWTSGKSEKTSAHFVVDEGKVMQLLELNQVGWHTGFLFTPTPEVPQAKNGNSIGIELCVNEDGNFIETMKNGIALTKYLMDLYDIPAEKVITHNQSSGKICPAMMIKDNPALWKLFKAEISSSNEETIDILATP